MPNARAQTAASNALAQLSKGLGQPGSIVYGEQRLTVAWSSYSATSIAEELRALGADISTNMAIPARLAGQTTEHVVGVLAGAPLSGTVTLGPNDTRSLEVQLYTAALESDNARLEPAMDMVHAILSAAGRPERILGTYIARQLQNGSPEASQSLAANLAALLADHLTSQLPLESAPALQSAAAVRRK